MVVVVVVDQRRPVEVRPISVIGIPTFPALLQGAFAKTTLIAKMAGIVRPTASVHAGEQDLMKKNSVPS